MWHVKERDSEVKSEGNIHIRNAVLTFLESNAHYLLCINVQHYPDLNQHKMCRYETFGSTI